MSDVIELDDFPRHLSDVGEAIAQGDYSATLRSDVRPLVLQSIRDNFNSSASADGNAWAPRVDPGDGHPLLQATGALMQAATGGGPGHVTAVEPNELSVGVDKEGGHEGGIPGAAVHQFGYKRIPARPYLEARDEALDQAGEAILDRGLELIAEVA